MRFSIRVNNDLSYAEYAELAEVCERCGFDQIWISNDLFLRSAPALVAAVAGRTSRIELGIAIMNPYSVHVSEIAMAAATLQEISGGRFLLGVGAGAEEFLAWAGLPRERPLGTTAEAVRVLRALLGHDDVTAAELPAWFGADSVLRFPLTTPVPVYVGAMGPKMLAMAGELADGVLPLLYPPEHFAVARRNVQVGLDRRAAPRAFDLPACFWVSISDEAAAGRAALAEKLAYYGPSISPHLLAAADLSQRDFAPAAALAQRGESAVGLIDDRMLALGIAGDQHDVLARCRGLIALGADHLSFGPPLGPDPVGAVELLGRDVLDVLREEQR